MTEQKTINVRIKLLPPKKPGGEPQTPTGKVWLRAGSETARGCRPLEPLEIVALDEAEAIELLQKLPHELEMTHEPPTRPLYFSDLDEALRTSRHFNPDSESRMQAMREAMAANLAAAQSDEVEQEMSALNDIEQRELALQAREAALAAREAALNAEPADEISDDDVAAASDNKISPADLKALREQPPEEPAAVPEPAAPRRRRRRQAAG